MITEQEWVVLFRYVRAMFPGQRFDEYTSDAWYEVLADYDAPALKQAIATHSTKRPFISLAEIIAAVRAGRSENLSHFQYEPDPDETTTQFLANLRSQIAAVADGQRPPVLPALPPGERPDLAAIGRQVPAENLPPRRRGPLSIACPYCHAPASKPCKTGVFGRRKADVHPARLDASRSQP